MMQKFKEIGVGTQFCDADGTFIMKTSVFCAAVGKYNAVTINLGSINDYDPNDINNIPLWYKPDDMVSVVNCPMDGLDHDVIKIQKFIDYFEKNWQDTRLDHWKIALDHAKWWLRLDQVTLGPRDFDDYDADVKRLVKSTKEDQRVPMGTGWYDMKLRIWKWSKIKETDDEELPPTGNTPHTVGPDDDEE